MRAWIEDGMQQCRSGKQKDERNYQKNKHGFAPRRLIANNAARGVHHERSGAQSFLRWLVHLRTHARRRSTCNQGNALSQAPRILLTAVWKQPLLERRNRTSKLV